MQLWIAPYLQCCITQVTPHNATEQHAQMQGAAIFRCPLIATMLFHALCGAQRSSVSLSTDGAERALDFSRTMRYNSGTRTPRSRYHIMRKTGKTPTKHKGITRYTTFVKFHRTVTFKWVQVLFITRTKKKEALRPPFSWYGRQDLNLHGYPLEPKSNVSANSTTPALASIVSQSFHKIKRAAEVSSAARLVILSV